MNDERPTLERQRKAAHATRVMTVRVLDETTDLRDVLRKAGAI